MAIFRRSSNMRGLREDALAYGYTIVPYSTVQQTMGDTGPTSYYSAMDGALVWGIMEEPGIIVWRTDAGQIQGVAFAENAPVPLTIAQQWAQFYSTEEQARLLAAQIPLYAQGYLSGDPAFADYWRLYGPFPVNGSLSEQMTWMQRAAIGGGLVATEQQRIADVDWFGDNAVSILTALASFGITGFGPLSMAQDVYSAYSAGGIDALITGAGDVATLTADADVILTSGEEAAAADVFDPYQLRDELIMSEPGGLYPPQVYADIPLSPEAAAYEAAQTTMPLYTPQVYSDLPLSPEAAAYEASIPIPGEVIQTGEEIPRLTITSPPAPSPEEVIWEGSEFVATPIDITGGTTTAAPSVTATDVLKAGTVLGPSIIRAVWPEPRPNVTGASGGQYVPIPADEGGDLQAAGTKSMIIPWGLLIAAALALSGN